jgi:hypothetical protein
MTNTQEVMDFLVSRRATGLKLEVIADLFDRLIWILDDNGYELEIVRKRWLEGDDPIRAEIALRMNETFPYEEYQAMEEAFSKISNRCPHLKCICEAVLTKRKIQSV